MATYTKITVDVPQAQVEEALPEVMFFYVDTRFSPEQRNRIRTLIGSFLFEWKTHFDQMAENGRSDFQNCCNKYARFNLGPVWLDEKIANGASAAAVMMDAFTRAFIANGFGRSAKAFIMYQIPLTGTYFAMKGVNGSNPDTTSLSITVNPKAISRTDLTNITLTGSLHHAWIHRLGWRHPSRVFTSYMAGESSMCVMRGNRDKVPGQKDSVYTRFLD